MKCIKEYHLFNKIVYHIINDYKIAIDLLQKHNNEPLNYRYAYDFMVQFDDDGELYIYENNDDNDYYEMNIKNKKYFKFPNNILYYSIFVENYKMIEYCLLNMNLTDIINPYIRNKKALEPPEDSDLFIPIHLNETPFHHFCRMFIIRAINTTDTKNIIKIFKLFFKDNVNIYEKLQFIYEDVFDGVFCGFAILNNKYKKNNQPTDINARYIYNNCSVKFDYERITIFQFMTENLYIKKKLPQIAQLFITQDTYIKKQKRIEKNIKLCQKLKNILPKSVYNNKDLLRTITNYL